MPFIERGIADTVLAVQRRYTASGFGLLENGDDLAVGKAAHLHVSFLFLSKNSTSKRALFS